MLAIRRYGQFTLSGEDLYLVKWKGYSLADCTWEPGGNLDREWKFRRTTARDLRWARYSNLDVILLQFAACPARFRPHRRPQY